MKLYYSAGSCSTSCHITLEESGLKYQAIAVDWDDPKDANAEIVTKLNPMGTLPVFVTDDGKQLDQNLAIHMYIADKASEKHLLPPVGTFERAEAINMLSFVAADLHKSIGALFSLEAMSKDKEIQNSIRKAMMKSIDTSLSYMNAKLEKNDYLTGKSFTPADAYAFVVVGWTKWMDIPINSYKNIESFMKRMGSRPAVIKVLKEEKLS